MTAFQQHVDAFVQRELAKVLQEHGFVLETDFCNKMCEKYSLTLHSVRPSLRRISSRMGLIKRHLSDELKCFYELETVTGYPVIYVLEK